MFLFVITVSLLSWLWECNGRVLQIFWICFVQIFWYWLFFTKLLWHKHWHEYWNELIFQFLWVDICGSLSSKFSKYFDYSNCQKFTIFTKWKQLRKKIMKIAIPLNCFFSHAYYFQAIKVSIACNWLKSRDRMFIFSFSAIASKYGPAL